MLTTAVVKKFFSLADLVILLVIATVIYGIVAMGHEWSAEFHPVTQIDLSAWALPKYTFLSAIRGILAYFISLTFALGVGYVAAKSPLAERFIIPLLDILQTIPVLGFLPGLVLGLIALFPRTNIGLELAAIIMIFTGQVWNMTFSFYSSLKSIPPDFQEASRLMGLRWSQRFFRVELPFSAVNLVWNSIVSMAGGWFFLSVCEAFTLGTREFRLPGIGAYMALAIARGNVKAMVLGASAMIALILVMDFMIWRPILAWARRFRVEEVPGVAPLEPLMAVVLRESRIVRWLKLLYRDLAARRRERAAQKGARAGAPSSPRVEQVASSAELPMPQAQGKRAPFRLSRPAWIPATGVQAMELALAAVLLSGILWGGWKLFGVLGKVSASDWVLLLRNTIWTFFRVLLALVLSTLWAVPVGIWIGISPKRARIAQPIIQVLASFPAPMLFPLVLMALFHIGMSFEWAAMILMTLGVHWYVLFNVFAGALRVSRELDHALHLMEASRWDRWRTLYLPSVFPSLVTGWVVGTAGAWNSSIVAEYISFRGNTLQASGLGAVLSVAASNQNFPLLAAGLTIMVLVVVLCNRAVWGPLYHQSQTRYRLDI